ncbi:helix-turn-helix domain-containing protein [Streptomyces sp. NPDC090025]|uniref:helix-turn-helix domain-containing protein n=1 Tax=Streptomyces sp. NPDC090025 TaxID=3365922 RepID=UPI003833257E
MTEQERQPRHSVRLTDPRALRAYAHPTRMALVGLLRRDGPFTATRAAELTGESVASCSYHLRILAKYGLVEQAPGGKGREKPWQATARYTEWADDSDDLAVAQATDALNVAVAEQHMVRLRKAMELRHTLPKEWRQAEQLGDTLLHLTAAELAELGERFAELVRPYEERDTDPARRPEGTLPVAVLRFAFVDRDLPDDRDDGGE